jgi:gluconokinase
VSTPRLVLMGVTGSGKSTVGRAVAQELGVEFVDGDDFHSTENIARMSAGIALTDEDRAEWLDALAGKIRDAGAAGVGVVVACSALKRRYRDILRAGTPDLKFALLKGSRSLIAERLAKRSGHFMSASLLDSQMATLEEPASDEVAWVFDIAGPPDELVAAIVARVRA